MSLRRSALSHAVWLCCLCTPILARTLTDEECAVGTKPVCTQPPAQVASPVRLHTAFVPDSTVVEVDTCSIPRATCQKPPAATIAPGRCCVQTTLTRPVAETLRLWEEASASLGEVSDRERAWMSRLNESQLSAHAVATAIRLLGPVRRDGVLSEFDWTWTESSLEGVPRDAAGRLFCPRLRVTLNQMTGGVADLQIATRDSQWVSVKRPEPMHDPAITVAGFKIAASDDPAALPPSPGPQRLADAVERSVVR